jgi:hypothetical protein
VSSQRSDVIRQVSPYSDELHDLVRSLEYREGWTFALRQENFDRGDGCFGTTLHIAVGTTNSYPPHQPLVVNHYMPVPAATYSVPSWRRWLLEQVLLVERHEACEFFTIDGEKPYAPNHGPGEDPYRITELTTDEARRTSFRGELNR